MSRIAFGTSNCFIQHNMAPTKLIFVTGNKNKLREVRNILDGVIEIENQAIEVPEIQGTIEEIAKEKARRAAEKVGLYVYTIYMVSTAADG